MGGGGGEGEEGGRGRRGGGGGGDTHVVPEVRNQKALTLQMNNLMSLSAWAAVPGMYAS